MTHLKDLECFLSMDWGYNAPGCVLWWVCLLDGHLHIVKEMKFQRMIAGDVGTHILTGTKALGVARVRYVAADPAMWQHTGASKGEAIGETLSRRPIGLPMKKSDNDRFNGWARVHELLGIAPDGRPWLTIDPSCRYLIRSLKSAVSDKTDLDDVDTHGDDHALDALRYGAMSRPSPTRLVLDRRYPKKSVGHLLQQARDAAREAA